MAAVSQLIEKLKFREKFILVNIVVMPLSKSLKSNASEECELPARNKFLTCDVWKSFVYPELYKLFRLQFGDKYDPLYEPNEEYSVTCTERPYLEMKCTIRDKAYRNNLNMLVKEEPSNLYETCIDVEISDIGRSIADQIDERNKVILRLIKENDALKSGENASIKNQKQTVDAAKTFMNHSESDGDEQHDPTETKSNVSELSLSSNSHSYIPSGQKPANGQIDPKEKPEMLGACAKRETLPRSSKTLANAWIAESLKEIEQEKGETDKRNTLTEKGEGSSKTLCNSKRGSRRKANPKEEQKKHITTYKRLDCTNLSATEIRSSFERYETELHEIFLEHKDKTERDWQACKEHCYFTDANHICNEEQQMLMLGVLDEKFVPAKLQGKYTEFFTSVLTMEWSVRLYMEQYKFTDRQAALDFIRMQDKAYYDSLDTESLDPLSSVFN